MGAAGEGETAGIVRLQVGGVRMGSDRGTESGSGEAPARPKRGSSERLEDLSRVLSRMSPTRTTRNAGSVGLERGTGSGGGNTPASPKRGSSKHLEDISRVLSGMPPSRGELPFAPAEQPNAKTTRTVFAPLAPRRHLSAKTFALVQSCGVTLVPLVCGVIFVIAGVTLASSDSLAVSAFGSLATYVGLPLLLLSMRPTDRCSHRFVFAVVILGDMYCLAITLFRSPGFHYDPVSREADCFDRGRLLGKFATNALYAFGFGSVLIYFLVYGTPTIRCDFDSAHRSGSRTNRGCSGSQ
ncbi:hypothetical protein T492DRAFT_887491 [Pavlovales sp. CCMP2436]|nr:hypothetical protein T492DRAFT_887491 [Pavlovales sp. CCMP2436]